MTPTGILISARTASKRLPEKALLKICGLETILLLAERMQCCREPEKIVLCTTEDSGDDELARIASSAGLDVFRGEGEDVARRLLDACNYFGFEHFVRVTGDDILRCIAPIDQAVHSHLESGADYTCMKGVYYGGDSEIISREALEFIVNYAEVPENTEYLTWYLENPEVFKINQFEVSKDYSRSYRLTLDTESDLRLLDEVYRKFYRKGEPVDEKAALKWLDRHPEISGINKTTGLKVNKKDLNLNFKEKRSI